ncbi:glycosyltransferase family 4 protein [Rhodopseudomonas palustris]|uniref:glycosyltransferase family 4 protein n=1 Tax=Rhodopseudomonas palustris TaxID=1076 RepID=UPI0020CCF78D|nr:glycosyltransferase family 4 protein [Rhodopseudomonas palustris]MCP9627211.1 glycosyltransferase family 4 protein [Rhodopseudomonas palustris]
MPERDIAAADEAEIAKVAERWSSHTRNCAEGSDERSAIERSGLFDREFYLATYSDVKAAGIDPLKHYAEFGAREFRAPNRWFDPNYYRSQFVGFLGAMNPLLHYVEEGERQGFKPHPKFDPRRYRALYPVVAEANVSPLWHFLHFGSMEHVETRRYTPPRRIELVKPPLREWVRPASVPMGVNFVSPLSRISGLGVSARGFVDALQSAEIPVHLIEWTQGFEHQETVDTGLKGVQSLQPINLIHMNADIFHLVANGLRQNGILSPDRYNIGIWYWELAAFRHEWMPWVALLDEIWCASSFNVRAVDVVSARPVNLLRPAVVPPVAPGQFSRSHFGLNDDSLVFFYNCDLSSRIDRKNPEALAQAFRAEFGDDPRYQLVLKIGMAGRHPKSARRVASAAGGASNILLMDRTLSDQELADLLRHAFAYVSPHRSEGLGLTIIEAMLSGCPVIATPYGGAADFVVDGVARPLAYRLTEIEVTDEPYRRGCVWADPSVADIRRAMRELADAPDAARALGRRGKAHAEALFSREATSRAVRARLEEIWQHHARR